ncbi:MAG: hypothetical protein IJA85_10280 [Clostridia bacterium]|nr:hypothetical protein [Clostridia bacterium]
MKRSMIIIILLACTLFSCSSENAAINDSIYQYIRVIGDSVTVTTESGGTINYGSPPILSRFNTLTGSVTPLCADPLCRHVKEDDCPFADVERIHVYNGMVYFLSRYHDTSTIPSAYRARVCSYDPINTKTAVLYEYELTGGGYRFGENLFFVTTRDQEDTEHTVSVDLVSGKVTKLPNNTEAPSFIYDNRYYYYDDSNTKGYPTAYYSTKEDGSDKQVHFTADCIAIVYTDIFDGRYFIWGEYGKKESNGKEVLNTDHVILHRYDLKKDEDKTINENFSDSYFAQYEGKLYYAKIVENPPLLGIDLNDNSKERYNASGGIIWEFDPESCEERIFLELPGYTLDRVGIECINGRIVIDYRNVDYNNPLDPDNDGWYDYPTEYGKIIFDPQSGEYTAYPLPEFH